MQNKANFRKAKINVSPAITMNYEQLTMNYANKNKPNSKPIKPKTNPKQTQLTKSQNGCKLSNNKEL